jgi:hypothetical protein
MKKFVLCISMFTLFFCLCSCNLSKTATKSGQNADTSFEQAEGFPLPDWFSSIDELVNVVRSGDFSGYGNLDDLEYIYVFDKIPEKLEETEIIITHGSVGVYYAIQDSESVLVEKFKSDSEAYRFLTTLKVITYRNTVNKTDTPSMISESFEKYEKNGRTYYLSEVNTIDDTLLGWEIFWVQDDQDVCVGVPVNYGKERAIDYCSCIKFNVK